MAPRSKTYADRVRDRSFLARRPEHRALLAEGELHRDPRWAAFQKRYRNARDDDERYAVCLALERSSMAEARRCRCHRKTPSRIGAGSNSRTGGRAPASR